MKECPVCGSTDFELENGARLCIICGAHEMFFSELTENEEWDLHQPGSKYFTYVKKDNEIEENSEESSSDWCTFEIYNIILKGWTDSFLKLGVSKKFRDAVFKLWVRYLQKRNIAFTETITPTEDVEKLSDVEILTKRDAVHLLKAEVPSDYKEKKEKEDRSMKLLKNKIMKKSLKHDTGSSFNKSLSCSMRDSSSITRLISEKINETLKKTDSNQDAEMNSESDTDDFNETNFESNPLLIPADEEEESCKDEAEVNGKENLDSHRLTLKKWQKQYESERRGAYFKKYSPICMNLEKLLSIVYLGLLIAQEDILLLDLVRLCREGFIPYFSAACLVPKDKLICSGDLHIFNRNIPSALELRICSARMAHFLSLQALPLPPLSLTVEKITHALNLPSDISTTMNSLMKACVPQSYCYFTIPPFEVMAAAILLLTFKITYGLDDVHEEILSDYAEKFNAVFKAEKKKYRAFSWREWQKYINGVDWWTSKTNFGAQTQALSCQSITPTVDPKRFSHYFWSDGVWTLPIVPEKKSKGNWQRSLLNSTLELKKRKLEDLVEEDRLFVPYKFPRVGVIAQYVVNASERDRGEDKEDILKDAKELLRKEFINYRFNWLMFSHELTFELREIGKPVQIIKTSLNHPEEETKHISMLDKNKDTVTLLVPDPLHCFWTPNLKTNKSLPHSFRWLLRTLSQLCETYETDIYGQYLRLQKFHFRHSHAYKTSKINDNFY